MALDIRIARPEDRTFIEALGKQTAMDSVPAGRTVDVREVLDNYIRLLEIVFGQSHVALVAHRSGVRVGFLLMLDAMPDEVTGNAQGFVAYMAVDPRHRNAGVGAALLERGEDEARKRRLPAMALMVTEDNAPARTLYERAGFSTERRLLCKML
ncbi:MAG: GNAT family N-acetyltransferase [Candidatus Eremiobacteraeota bacterium]|nr:GNAT family N-acetyltransferase [Candidatus Eremiobacteraeota bacterium]